MKSSFRIALRLEIMAAMGLSAGCTHTAPATAPSGLLGKPVSMALPSDAGEMVQVPPPRARATIVDFFAPTCDSCKRTLPVLFSYREGLASRGVPIVLVAVLAPDESTDAARTALLQWGVDAHFLVDRGDVSKTAAGVTSLPTTLVLDDQGRLRWSAPEGATADDVVAAVP